MHDHHDHHADDCCHDHHHHHTHDDHCTCGTCQNGLHHTEGSIPQGAALLSVKKTFLCNAAAASIERNARSLFHAIADMIAFDDIIPGHLKGVIRCGSGIVSLSMTRLDTIDCNKNAVWKQLDLLQEYTVTVNVLTVMPTELTQATLDNMMIHAFQM